jgi:hypothetical protein
VAFPEIAECSANVCAHDLFLGGMLVTYSIALLKAQALGKVTFLDVLVAFSDILSGW